MDLNRQAAPPQVSRTLLGICAGAMTVVGLIGWFTESWPVFYNSLLRAGILLLGVWLAFPQLTEGRWKLTAGLGMIGLLLVVILASRPRLLPLVVVFLVTLYVLHHVIARWTKYRAGGDLQ